MINNDPTLKSLGIAVPCYIKADITVEDVRAITKGGCASGAYTPAVNCVEARKTMADHWDAVFDAIERSLGEIPRPVGVTGLNSYAVFYLSMAVELWADRVEAEIDARELEEEGEAA